MVTCGITTGPRSITVAPHGSPMGRMSVPMKSSVMVRTTMSIPSVMIATENNGSPIIGRMKTRSNAIPTSAEAPIANSAESDHCSHSGAPGIHRPGMLRVTAKAATRKAPSPARAPCEKFTTCVALKMMTKPMASTA